VGCCYGNTLLRSANLDFAAGSRRHRCRAAGADRDIIRECELIGIALPEFCDLCLEAMTGVADEIGL